MPFYRIDFRHTAVGRRNLVVFPPPMPRLEAIQELVAAIGGRVVSFYYQLGEYDGFVIVEAPSNAAIVSAVLKVNKEGGVEAKTTALLTEEEFREALGQADGLPYQAPQPGPVPEQGSQYS